MKHFVDIERLREDNTELRNNNCSAFNVGDHIVVQTKFDASNSSIYYDVEEQKLHCCSRKRDLDAELDLNGFYDWVQTLDPKPFSLYPNYIFFGEWNGIKHTVQYKEELLKNWFVYDIYDTKNECYIPQTIVKNWCSINGFNYIETLYDGEFKSWEHIKSFLNVPSIYGDMREGVVVKNQTSLNKNNVESSSAPTYIKIINEKFSEVKATKKKVPRDMDNEMLLAQEIIPTIVTKNRVEKEIYKMRDEGILPLEFESKDMKIVAQNLPRRIVEDCLKEEKAVYESAGKCAGKVANALTMQYAKEILLGV